MLTRAVSDMRRSVVAAVRRMLERLYRKNYKRGYVERVYVDYRDPTYIYVVVRLSRHKYKHQHRYLLMCTTEYEPVCSVLGYYVAGEPAARRITPGTVEVRSVDEVEKLLNHLVRLDCPPVRLNDILRGVVPACMMVDTAEERRRGRLLRFLYL